MTTKRTLLKFVQDIARSINSDEIDSLDDGSVETDDILNMLEMTYDEILARRDWDFLRNTLLTLDDTTGDINTLDLPGQVQSLSDVTIRYRDVTDGRNEVFRDVNYLTPDRFLRQVQAPNENEDNVDTITTADGVTMLVFNDREPLYYTSFDGRTLYFDAYPSDRGSRNLGVDAVILGDFKPVMDWTDETAKLPIPERMEMFLLHETIATCSIMLRQTQNPKSEQIARRQYAKLRELEPSVRQSIEVVNYGRSQRNSNFRSDSGW